MDLYIMHLPGKWNSVIMYSMTDALDSSMAKQWCMFVLDTEDGGDTDVGWQISVISNWLADLNISYGFVCGSTIWFIGGEICWVDISYQVSLGWHMGQWDVFFSFLVCPCIAYQLIDCDFLLPSI